MFTLQKVTQKQIDTLTGGLDKAGVDVAAGKTPNSYTINGHGIAADAIFDPTDSTLTVTITRKPFFIPESTIEHGIIEAISTTQAGVPLPSTPTA
jgi:hypothetical protein